jgi:hypothetical protein
MQEFKRIISPVLVHTCEEGAVSSYKEGDSVE